jgi:hypothetical protein
MLIPGRLQMSTQITQSIEESGTLIDADRAARVGTLLKESAPDSLLLLRCDFVLNVSR